MFLVLKVLLRTLFSLCPFCPDNPLDLTSSPWLPVPSCVCQLRSLLPAGRFPCMSHGFVPFRSGAIALSLLSSWFSCCSSQKPPGFSGLCLPAYPMFTQPPGSSHTGSASKIPPESSPPLMPSMAPIRAFIIFSWTACCGILISSPCLSSHPLPKKHSPHSCWNPIMLLWHIQSFDDPSRGHRFSCGTRGLRG